MAVGFYGTMELLAAAEVLPEGSLRLLRLFGRFAEVDVPAELSGRRVTEIGPYCFAKKEVLATEVKASAPAVPEGMYPLAGELIETVRLPDTVQALAAHAFYDCRNLRELSVGTALRAVGNDAFMNCKSLRSLLVRGRETEETGLRSLLSQIRGEITVTFGLGDTVFARVLYPDFLEQFEEISPAHIFGLHVEGEGYRARKQFNGEIVDLAGYDRVFFKASHEEEIDTLFCMAVYRLRYPSDLKEAAREEYRAFLRKEERVVLSRIIAARKEAELRFLCESGFLSEEAWANAVQEAARAGWSRGNLLLLRASVLGDAV